MTFSEDESRLPVEMTTYVGRRTEITEARKLLRAGPVVTLTGPGGVGKTRLALRVASAARAAFHGAVVFVGLGDLREAELLVNTVANQIGLGDRSARPPLELLVDQLRDRRLLLVLDNCEHLVDECARLVDVLARSCPELAVLATSRQSLGVDGERILPVPPLSIPQPGASAEQMDGYDAVRLFVDRATARVPSFAITPDNVEDVVRLSRALDGLPLAIELAAVRLRSLSVHQLADRLDNPFTLLAARHGTRPDRHSTFQALIDWSYELCTAAERLLWARASVFSGTFDLDAAEQVCSGEGLDRTEVLNVLDGLIDKSILLREEQAGVARYQMLETLRQYGEDRLRTTGESVLRKQRHRDRYLGLAQQFKAEWFGAQQVAWIRLLKHEHANIRAAVDFCTTSPEEAVIGLRMVRAIKEYWVLRGLNTEGRMWLTRLLDAAPQDAPGRAAGEWMYAFLALLQSDPPAYTSALATAEAIGDEVDRAYVHHVRAYAALIGNDGERAAKLFRMAAEVFAAQRDEGGEMWATYNYGLAISLTGNLEHGREVLRDCVQTCVGRGEVFWRSWALWSRSAAEYLCGDIDEAKKAGLELLRLQRSVDDRVIIAFSLTVLAGCATHTGEAHRAARLLGAANTVWRQIGATPTSYTAFVEPTQRDLELVTNQLGTHEAIREFGVGAALSLTQALRYALGEDQPTQASAQSHLAPLTKRQAQIAELVADGLTNREIADRLVIARRTAETHIDHILTKLGFTNRTQVAAWIVRSRHPHER